MSFPKYDEYDESEIYGLEFLPSNWCLKRLKDVVTYNDSTLDENTPEDKEILYVDISSVNTTDGIHSKESMLFGNAPSRARRCVQNGDVIVSTVRTYLKAIARVINPEDNLVVSTGFAVIRPRSNFHTGYAGYLLLSQYFIDEVISRSTGVSYPAINASELVRISIPVPTYEEQTAIAKFLDAETSKIDALVAEQRRLIELLKEKRQAVISHAVTKGLNPSAPLKDSGIEWLGDVPEHWEVKSVRHACQIDNTLRTPIDKQSRLDMVGDYPYYGPTGILSRINKFVVEGEYFLLGEDGDHFLKFNKQPMTVNVEGQFNVNNHAHLIKGKGNCSTKWASLYFEHKDLLPWLIKQGVGRYKLRKEKLVTIPILVPPTNEQENILDRVNHVKSVTKTLEKEAKQAIDLLQERRTALISAAVTGKIDVREYATLETA
tara:strand:+ start:7751 stop:9049 length:1299 start_codon:yes stop_codon:yes gene_type:complete